MKIAIYGKSFRSDFNKYITKIFEILEEAKSEVIVFEPFWRYIQERAPVNKNAVKLFRSHKDLTDDYDIFLSIGGDGTFLESTSFVRDKGIPIAGINSGRLGFLANISKKDIQQALEKILKAMVVYKTQDFPPKTHNLFYLLEKSKINLSDAEYQFIGEISVYQLEGRYPGTNYKVPDKKESLNYYKKTERLVKWIKEKLEEF